jgi:hypothetical protein
LLSSNYLIWFDGVCPNLRHVLHCSGEGRRRRSSTCFRPWRVYAGESVARQSSTPEDQVEGYPQRYTAFVYEFSMLMKYKIGFLSFLLSSSLWQRRASALAILLLLSMSLLLIFDFDSRYSRWRQTRMQPIKGQRKTPTSCRRSSTRW